MKTKYYSRVALLATLLVALPPIYGAAAPASSSSASSSSHQVVILGAAPHFETNTLLISGANFGNGPAFSGTVSLYAPPEGIIRLTVTAFNPARQEILVALPPSLATSFPGSYVLTVTAGSGTPSTAAAEVAIGAVGPVGPQGPKGDKGDKGDTGAQGPIGMTGATGATGAVGPIGPQGLIGLTGAAGAQGETGVIGPQGPKGDKGDKGDTGAQGPIGLTGATGARGETGAQGPQGFQGATGSQGPIGLTGPMGPLGPKGEIGTTGAIGAQGPQGIQGIPGAGYLFPHDPVVISGTSPSVPAGLKRDVAQALSFEGTKYWPFSDVNNGTWFAVVGFDASGNIVQRVDVGGNRYISEISVNTAARTVSFTGQSGVSTLTYAQGLKGDTGAQGPAGPVGAVGPTGSTGAIGPQGPQGSIGLTGAAGSMGPRGYTGETGLQGTQGIQGPAGPVGPQGPAYTPPYGKLVGPKLYEVHSRVLWDIGWLMDSAKEGPYVIYRSGASRIKYLSWGNGNNFFLSPLRGYGIPEVQSGATRKVRLHVVYSHRMDGMVASPNTPTIRIGDVDFGLLPIYGAYDAIASGWSNFKTYAEYGHLGHTTIGMFYNGSMLWYWNQEEPIGIVNRVEAFFYDEFP